jgi:murein DD-endopeptidase MepM/ murein hydrolase activator NlpD
MQFNVLKASRRNLARGCAIFVIAAAASGCSSQVARFSDGLDGITTASTDNQRSIINGQDSQPYPADVAAQPAPMTGGGYSSGSVGRSALQPVSSQTLPPVAEAQPAPVTSAPVRVASAPAASNLDQSTTGTIKPVKQAAAEKPFKPAQPDARLADQKVPAPAKQQTQTVAVMPQQPKLKDGKSAAPVDATAANDPNLKKVAAASAGGSYTVQQGDTLSAISRKTGVGVTALKQANGLQDGLIRVGQKLKVPGAGGAATATVAAAKPVAVDPVKTASTPPAAQQAPTQTLASYTPPKKADKVIEQAQDDGAAAPDSTGIGKMRWPVRGRVISGFGGGQGGDGIDISVPKGTPIKAAENGVVIYAGNGLKEFGNTVLVRHENGLVTVYGNASELTVTRGQKVKRGEEIALSGMSGNAASPKLHFEIRKNSAPVDPSTYLE